ncbi:50S ribosomal protein L3 [Marinicella pacifica]|jgi:large subunit ribosomal protein L3|uniref:Large ribosomal subunit protein uL3 n=1 Tax=Marinicella pacifica TaxID=1171543 RepID=A0A917CSI0_9GAMM|nr:50S ribosomal protein L3 [Marinicella pacifica]GGF97178.1 50S ribosomal protein L3 [Marinicella pacifica]
MSLGIIGKKVGMTRVFNDKGESVPVTVINVEPNIVAQVKSVDTDGYQAVQVTTGSRKQSKVNAPTAGHFKKAGIEAGAVSKEFRTDQAFSVGDAIELTMFEDGQKVNVTGTSKGKGYQGVIKRYNFHMQDATHGNSLSHRAPGSIGQCQTPGRVFKGKKMSGHMGAEQVTTRNLELVKVDVEKGLLLIKGAVPGAKQSLVVVSPLA